MRRAAATGKIHTILSVKIMKTFIQSLLLIACALSSPAGAADAELVIPEIGVKFADFPPDISKPKLTERPEGYDALTMLGLASLVIYREDAPTHRAITDPALQEELRAEFAKKVKRVDVAGLTTVGGQRGWMMSGVESNGPVNIWRLQIHTVVDDHVYRLSLHALGSSQRPPEFERVAALIQKIGFVPVDRAPVASPAPGEGEGRLPRFVSNGDSIYPAVAFRKQQQGSVVVSFRIDEQGRVQDLKEDFSSARELGRDIPAFLQNGRFRVPANWAESAQTERRFTLEFQLSLAKPGSQCPPRLPPREPGSEVWAACKSVPR
jgi:TonB family protein